LALSSARLSGWRSAARSPDFISRWSQASVASLGGSSLADELVRIGGIDSSVWLGTLAGLFSCILLAMLMVIYYTNPETGRPWKR
jgi:hypothetical protein